MSVFWTGASSGRYTHKLFVSSNASFLEISFVIRMSTDITLNEEEKLL